MLSPAAQKIINDYLSLPFEQVQSVSCPYYNNKRQVLRGGLRAGVGKGSPDDIVEEALIQSLHDKKNLNTMTDEEIKKFLVDHHLGVDCSAFVYYILDAELKSLSKGSIKKYLHFPYIKNPLRHLLTKLRTAENTDVKTLAHARNSNQVELKNVQPGDFVVLLGGGREHERDHIIIITDVKKENNVPVTLEYAHSDEWPSDGRYNHGVRIGTMRINNVNGSILDQPWSERKDANVNELFKQAGYSVGLHRLNALN